MKPISKLLLIGGISLLNYVVYAQTNIKNQVISPKNGTPRLIEFYPSTQTLGASFSPPSGATITISSTTAGSVLTTFLNPPTGNTFTQVSTETDTYSITHTRFQQYYNGIKVEGGVYIVHSKNGYVTLMNGEFKPVINNIPTSPSISEGTALIAAKNAIEKATNFETVPAAELVVIDPQMLGVNLRLAYKFKINVTMPESQGLYVYVDAVNGNILLKNSFRFQCFSTTLPTKSMQNPIRSKARNLTAVGGTLVTKYSGTLTNRMTDFYNGSYRLRDYSRGGSTGGIETYNAYNASTYNPNTGVITYDLLPTDYTDTDNSWQEFSNNARKDDAALDVHAYTQNTYDYFKNTFGRNSIDGKGLVLKSYVNLFGNIASTLPSSQKGILNNAEWTGDKMIYRIGDGTTFSPLTSQDIVSHELGHGIFQFSMPNNGMPYYFGESGALNEAFSDIWGATVESSFFSNKQTWLLGEEIDLVNHTGLRNMSNPKLKGYPNCYRGINWNWDTGYDAEGVHINSSVINYWYYLLCQGSGGTKTNDYQISYNVSPIGMSAAAKILYYMETNFLTPTTNFIDFRDYMPLAVNAVYPGNTTISNAVNEALKAVGLTNPLQVGQGYYSTPCSTVPHYTSTTFIGLGDFNITLMPGVYPYSYCFSNKQSFAYNGTPTVGFSLTFVPNAKTIIEAGKKIGFLAEVNQVIDGQSYPNSKIILDPGNTGQIVLRICSNYAPSGTRKQTDNSVITENYEKQLEPTTLSTKVFPNPSQAETTLEVTLPETSIVSVAVYDMAGRIIKSVLPSSSLEAGLHQYSFFAENSGTYLATFIINGKKTAKKIVIQK